jgi:hypothetical protein
MGILGDRRPGVASWRVAGDDGVRPPVISEQRVWQVLPTGPKCVSINRYDDGPQNQFVE